MRILIGGIPDRCDLRCVRLEPGPQAQADSQPWPNGWACIPRMELEDPRGRR